MASAIPAIVTTRSLDDPTAIEAALEAKKTLPLRWYWDSEAHEFELAGIFHRSWQLAGPLHSVSSPGDSMVCLVGRVPIVVVRGKDDVLRGFVNVCRHRGYAVVRADQSRGTLQCAYHGWTYDLDGKLRAAPRCANGEFDAEDMALLSVSVHVWRNLVFVNPDPRADPMDVAFPELDDVVDGWDIDFATGYSYIGTSTYEIDGNWKAWCENTNECYHCPTIHKGSFDATFKSLRDREVLLTENLIGAINGYRERASLLVRHGQEPTFGERYIYVFPGTFISQDDYLAFAGYTVPVGPERTRFVAHSWVRDGVAPAFLDEWNEMWDQTLTEDAEAVAIQQQGLRSRSLDFGRLSGAADTTILKFHELVWRAYKRAMASTAMDEEGK